MDYNKLIKIADSLIKDSEISPARRYALEHFDEEEFKKVISDPSNLVEEFVDEDTGDSVTVERTPEEIRENWLKALEREFKEQQYQEQLRGDSNDSKTEELETRLKELQSLRKQLLTDMENDSEVLDNPDDGSYGTAVGAYGEQLDEIDAEIQAVEEELSSMTD